MENRKNYLATVLLAWFLGQFGIHRFYTGHIGIGIAQFLTLGGCGIWQLIDFICLCFGNYKDANGQDLDGYNPTTGKTIFFIWLGLVVLGFILYATVFGAMIASGLSGAGEY